MRAWNLRFESCPVRSIARCRKYNEIPASRHLVLFRSLEDETPALKRHRSIGFTAVSTARSGLRSRSEFVLDFVDPLEMRAQNAPSE
jgi:hypothetical protein